MKKTVNFMCEEINYSFKEDKIITDYDMDLNILIIWSKARHKEKDIIADLKANFLILQVAEINWNKNEINNNFHRLYGFKPSDNIATKKYEVGENNFIVIALKDKNPFYSYREDASGRLKIVNSNIIDKKKMYREWVGGNYMIHSTDNLREFYNNSILIFGKQKTLGFCKSIRPSKFQKINKDLIASNGWSSAKELFDALNFTIQYVVLRAEENINENINSLEGDIDIFCDDINKFASIANAKNIWNSNNFFHVKINNKNVLFDIRDINENYFDHIWSYKILKNRELSENNIFIPRIDDYFFSHLYHAYIHKPYFLNKYIKRLDKLSTKIGIKDFEHKISNQKLFGLNLLKGYLMANNYSVTIPKDSKVSINLKNICYLKQTSYITLSFNFFFIRVKFFIFRCTLILKKILKRNKYIFALIISIRSKYRKYMK